MWNKGRWLGWWYLSIGAGFLLLAIYNALVNGWGALIWLRLVLAAGFALLGWMQLKSKV